MERICQERINTASAKLDYGREPGSTQCLVTLQRCALHSDCPHKADCAARLRNVWATTNLAAD